MEIRYNVTGSQRKALAQIIGEVLTQEVTYKGAPSFAYEIGDTILDKRGTLTFAEGMTDETSTMLIASLKERGYIHESDISGSEGIHSPLEENADNTETIDGNKLVIDIPREGFCDKAIENLKKIIASKEALIKKAIGADSLSIEITNDKLCFPWFTLSGVDGESNAYAQLISAMCEMAKAQKRVIAKVRELENEKFTMRVFLIRLGFIGEEYKTARKILLSNLTGNSSWKNGPPSKDSTVVTESDEDTERISDCCTPTETDSPEDIIALAEPTYEVDEPSKREASDEAKL